jgi:hypothetical protein
MSPSASHFELTSGLIAVIAFRGSISSITRVACRNTVATCSKCRSFVATLLPCNHCNQAGDTGNRNGGRWLHRLVRCDRVALHNTCRKSPMTSWPDHLPSGNQKRFWRRASTGAIPFTAAESGEGGAWLGDRHRPLARQLRPVGRMVDEITEDG